MRSMPTVTTRALGAMRASKYPVPGVNLSCSQLQGLTTVRHNHNHTHRRQPTANSGIICLQSSSSKFSLSFIIKLKRSLASFCFSESLKYTG